MLFLADNSEVTEAITNIEKVWSIAEPIVWSIIKVIVVFIIGQKLIKFIGKLILKASDKANVDKGVASFLSSMAKIALNCILVIVICGIVGIPTASFVAVLGSCGLALGLALQGSLQNFAGGVLILFMKPFVVGDYIVVNGLEGTVYHIDICYTKLRTLDNRIVVLPNGSLSNANLVNVSTEAKRRVDITVPIGYQDDIKAVKTMLQGIADKNEKILKNEAKTIAVCNYGDDSVEIAFRVWCKTEDYWELKFNLLEEIKYQMDANGFTIPFHQLDVLLKK